MVKSQTLSRRERKMSRAVISKVSRKNLLNKFVQMDRRAGRKGNGKKSNNFSATSVLIEHWSGT